MTQVAATRTYAVPMLCRRCSHDAGLHVAKGRWVDPRCQATTIHLSSCLCPFFVPSITIAARSALSRGS